MDWKKLGDELLSRGWTQKAIAEEIGVVQSAVSEIFTGVTGMPRFSTGTALCELLNSGKRPPDGPKKAA